MAETGAMVLPVYFVGDSSSSMAGEPMAALNSGLRELRDEVAAHPLIGKKIRFAIVTFADSAQIRLPLSPLSEELQLPTLVASGSTQYANAFRVLRESIVRDIERLKGDGLQVHRPAVFFLSDGFPTDDQTSWRSALAELKAESWKARPNVLAFGVGAAEHGVIRDVASSPSFAFAMGAGSSTAAAITEFATALINSVVASAGAVARGETKFQFEKPSGFVELDGSVV